MDQGLRAQIHRFAENREIDYMSAKNLGNAYGIEFKNENELREFKQLIDRYLKTFNEDNFAQVEEACKKKDGTGNRKGDRDGTGPGMKKKKKEIEEENSVCPVCGKHIDSPAKMCPVCSKKAKTKEVKEAYDASAYASDDLDDMVGGYQPKKKGNKNPMKKPDTKRYKDPKHSKAKKRSDVQESISLADMFKL